MRPLVLNRLIRKISIIIIDKAKMFDDGNLGGTSWYNQIKLVILIGNFCGR